MFCDPNILRHDSGGSSEGATSGWVKLRRTQCEHMFSALPSARDSCTAAILIAYSITSPAPTERGESLLRVPSVRLDPFTGLAGNRQRRRHRAAVAEIDESSEKAITQPPASLQNAKRRPALANRLASFATSVS